MKLAEYKEMCWTLVGARTHLNKHAPGDPFELDMLEAVDELWTAEDNLEAAWDEECAEFERDDDDPDIPDRVRESGWQAIQAWECGVPEYGPI